MRSWWLIACCMAWLSLPTTSEAGGKWWDGIHQRSTTTAWSGLAVGGAGFALMGAGLALSNEESRTDNTLYGLGNLAAGIGAPIMAGGSLRARRAIINLGEPVPAPALASWLLWGAGQTATLVGVLAPKNSDTLYTIGGILVVAAYVPAGIQLALNRRSFKRLDRAATRARSTLRVSPGTLEGHPALLVSGSF